MFEWDARKAAVNRAKHGVPFEEAATVFGDPDALDGPDLRHSERERRALRLGRAATGRVLIVADHELGEYFGEAARFRAACVELFAGAPAFQERIEAILGAVAGGRDVRVPGGPNGSAYAPATIRGLHEGGQIDLHCENETVEFPAMWHLSRLIQARNQLSFYVVLACAESGGELVIHNARYGEGPGEQLARMERTGCAPLRAIAPYGHLVPRTDVGDLLVFDAGRYFHRVTSVVGQRTRWTMGGFLARSRDDRTVYYWS